MKLSVRFLFCALAAMLVSCAASGDSISKVKIYRLRTDQRINSPDPSIIFELKHRLHGASTTEEVRARTGNYYTLFWQVSDRSQPVTVRFEYKQADTRAKVQVQETVVDAPKRSNVTEFQVTGEAFAASGTVSAWRASLVRGREVLATTKSHLWE